MEQGKEGKGQGYDVIHPKVFKIAEERLTSTG